MPSGIRSERLVLRAVTLRQEIDFARQDSLTCNRVYTRDSNLDALVDGSQAGGEIIVLQRSLPCEM